jgi:brefeldin A-resistance guanine nucleotide exchange factor 1
MLTIQLTRSDSPALLSSSLRTTSTLFATLLPHLKLQLELFLSYVIERLTPSHPTPIPPHLQHISRPGTPTLDNDSGKMPNADPSASSTPRPLSLLPPVPNETRELMLETLAQVASKPSFMVDCWVNFDCSTESEDMFERLIAFLIRVSNTTSSRTDDSGSLSTWPTSS